MPASRTLLGIEVADCTSRDDWFNSSFSLGLISTGIFLRVRIPALLK